MPKGAKGMRMIGEKTSKVKVGKRRTGLGMKNPNGQGSKNWGNLLISCGSSGGGP